MQQGDEQSGSGEGGGIAANLKRDLLRSQRVIVRIWSSAATGGENMGHVSVELEEQDKYMSLWPKQGNRYLRSAKETDGLGIVSSIQRELVPSLAVDIKYEGRPPEKIFHFYTLDPDAISAEFDRVKGQLSGWSLLGFCKDSESCASLAMRLLQAGGITSLLGGKLAAGSTGSKIAAWGASLGFFKTGSHGTQASGYALISDGGAVRQEAQRGSDASFYMVEMGVGLVVQNPDFLAKYLEEAKVEEEGKYPLTKGLDQVPAAADSDSAEDSDDSVNSAGNGA